MKKAVMRFTACVLATGMAFGGSGTVALADSVVAGLGMAQPVETERTTEVLEGTEVSVDTDTETGSDTQTTSVDTGTAADASAETAVETSTDSSADSSADVSADTSSEQEASEVQTEAVVDTSMSGEMAFAQCDVYINVRDSASTDGEVVGKVYNNGSVTILAQIGDWYQVQSGNVTGYVKAEYFATGEEAEIIAEETGYNVATVYPEALVIRSEPSEDSEQIGMAYESDQLEVVAYEGDWMKVALGNDVYGYVSAYYVSYDTYYGTAETLEEEQQRLDEQWLAYLAEQKAEEEAAAAAAEAAAAESTYYSEAATWEDSSYSDGTDSWSDGSGYTDTYTDTSYTDTSYTDTSYTGTTDLSAAQAAADAAYQTYLDAQATADEATQGMDEQAVYDTAAAAQAAYQEYLSAQNVVDALAAGQTVTAAASQETYVEDTYTEETTQAESWETEATTWETEAPQTEAAQTESVSYSSTGQSIADFAVQFVGNPYVWGGTSLTNGADCSGFTQSVFANFGISIPRTAAEQACGGTAVDLSSIQAGDLLFYSDGSGISHVSLYIGGGQVVHASTSSTGIIISSYNYRTPVCARRYY